jgi:disulfide bond formation protein DsbB
MTSRIGYVLGLLICLGLLAFALYLQYAQGEDPCPLCILQRIAFIAMTVVFAVAALHGPARRGAVAYSTLLVVIAGIGGAIAARQVWLQHLPKDKIPACGPGLEYMLDRFPLAEALRKILSGSGECAEAGWRFLGLTIAGWSLAWFVVLALFAVYIAARARPAPAKQGSPGVASALPRA